MRSHVESQGAEQFCQIRVSINDKVANVPEAYPSSSHDLSGVRTERSNGQPMFRLRSKSGEISDIIKSFHLGSLWRSLLLKTLWAHFWLPDTFSRPGDQIYKFSCQVSRRKIYDVNLVHTSLRRKIYQRLFYGEKSIIVKCTSKVVLLQIYHDVTFKSFTTWLYLAWHVTS